MAFLSLLNRTSYNLIVNSMKTICAKMMALLFASLAVLTIQAQDNDMDMTESIRDKPALGLKAGVNLSTIYDTRSEDLSNSAKIGFAGGVYLSIPIGTYIGLQPELLYSQKGYIGRGNIVATDVKYTRRADFLDVPLMLQIKPSEHLFIVAGPMYSFLLNKKLVINSGTVSVEQQTQLKDYNIRKNVFGVTGGIDLIAYPLVISGRVGFDLQNNNGDGTSSDPRYKNAWVQATLGFVF
jgi:hypothetical protein